MAPWSAQFAPTQSFFPCMACPHPSPFSHQTLVLQALCIFSLPLLRKVGLSAVLWAVPSQHTSQLSFIISLLFLLGLSM